MKRSFVLLTAMPPTIGHWNLIRFANELTPDNTIVIVCTQPNEPFIYERVEAIRQATRRTPGVSVQHYHKSIEQDPSINGFWDMWKSLMQEFGATSDDYIVASEPYGQKVAELIGAQFFPYDIDREITQTKAAIVRESPKLRFRDILPEFRKYIRTKVTIFGAESTGKTTLSKKLSKDLNATWLFEYARPYLENTINEITTRSMKAIWLGQKALQNNAETISENPIIIQDTDLFSTVGYWQFPHWTPQIGTCPEILVDDAIATKSDIYLITQSNIPFEQDPLRYGGTEREGSDKYWIDICKKYNLPYVILGGQSIKDRVREAKKIVDRISNDKLARIAYDRKGL